MFSMIKSIEVYIFDHIISFAFGKDIQTTFLEKLMIIIKIRQLYINDKCKKLITFSLNQNIGFCL